ncbi:MAG: DUF6383 domain-containing protein [Bacteroidales bacterium]|nr:DUF6383 domain-containing protein [Bacteroidales bacterium]
MVFVATFDGTEGIDNTEPDPYAITSQGNQVIISGVAEFPVRIFDAVGRLRATSTSHSDTAVFSAPATGVYLIQVGTYPATRIVLR